MTYRLKSEASVKNFSHAKTQEEKFLVYLAALKLRKNFGKL